MKRILTFWLLLALAAGAVAQTPTVVEKPSANSTAKPAAKTTTPAKSAPSAKPSSATVKVGATAQKTSVAAKAAVVAVQPASQKVVAVSPTKSMPASTAKAAPVAAKTTSASAARVVPAPATKIVPVTTVKTNATSTVKPIIAVKPAAQAAIPAKPVIATGPAAHGAVPPKAGLTGKPGTGTAVAATKDPFSGKNAKAGPVKAQAGPAKSPVASVVAMKDIQADKKPAPKKVDAAGRRDPFVSPVVNMGAVGSGCSTGKRCLAIDQVALRGVVKSENGMIAVVVNAMDKAYFLRENDPVFDGYVVKITGDSVVFKETFRDKLGKPLTRDVTKTISRPVA
jgi:Tfp pilus assembly protein PilP